MTPEHILTHVCAGMEVRTADGQTLGTVAQVWYGTDPTAPTAPCDDELCSRLEVQHGALGRSTVYVPASAILDVTTGRVILQLDAATVQEHDWGTPPPWISAAGGQSADLLSDMGQVTTSQGGG